MRAVSLSVRLRPEAYVRWTGSLEMRRRLKRYGGCRCCDGGDRRRVSVDDANGPVAGRGRRRDRYDGPPTVNQISAASGRRTRRPTGTCSVTMRVRSSAQRGAYPDVPVLAAPVVALGTIGLDPCRRRVSLTATKSPISRGPQQGRRRISPTGSIAIPELRCYLPGVPRAMYCPTSSRSSRAPRRS